MLLDELFGKSDMVELAIVRKDGKLSTVKRKISHDDHDLPTKPMFPINKDRS